MCSFACAAGQGAQFEQELAGIGPEIVAVEEPERLGRGGGIKYAAAQLREGGDVYALNGDELVDVDFAALWLGTVRPAGWRRSPSRSRSRSSASSTWTTPTSCAASRRPAASPTG